MEESKPAHNVQIQNPSPPHTDPAPPSQQPPPPPPTAVDLAQPPAASPSPPAQTASAPSTAPAPAAVPPPPAPAPVAVPPPAAVPPPPKSKKRPLEGNVQIQDCSYFKMRAVLKDIRPHLLEVVRSVDFRNCNGADELREKLKLLMQLYKQMTAEAVTVKKPKNAPEGQKLSNENGTAQKPQEQPKPSENKEAVDLEEQSCYIGGSAFGWNFITFLGNKPVYCGRTKESFRAAQAAS